MPNMDSSSLSDPKNLAPHRFLLCGLSRLAVRVARTLADQGADVTVLRRLEGADLLSALPDTVRVVECANRDVADSLRDCISLGGTALADGILALSEDDLDNVRAAAAAREAAPGCPVVLRTFDPALADALEDGLGVRRAFSVSALAAPGFIAAAAEGDVVETLRLGDADVPLCRISVRPGSPLVGLNTTSCKQRLHCALLAKRVDDKWEAAMEASSTPLKEGDDVLLGGLQSDILRVCCTNAGWWKPVPKRHARSPRRTVARAPIPSLLLPVAAALCAVLVIAAVVFAHVLHLSPVDAFYFVVTTATTTGYGDISLKDTPDWVKIFGCVVMLSGGALLGIVFSYLAARATAERLSETMDARAARQTDHLVLAGLGTIGYRIARQLSEIGLPVVVVEQNADTRFAAEVRARVPVVMGDVRLAETLERAGIVRARALLACTDNDLANIQACLNARRLRPDLITVARIFDDVLASRLPLTFGVSQAVSASGFAASAFVSAALDENAVRPVRVGQLDLQAVRYTLPAPLGPDTLTQWRERGVRVLAFRDGGSSRRPSELTGQLRSGSELILCGPSFAIDRLLDTHSLLPPS